MTDYAKLKRLAKSAPTGPWLVENDSMYFEEDGYTRHLLDADSGHDVEESRYYAALAFVAAANPSVVLSLLAEAERLATNRSKKERELEQELEVWRNGPTCWTCGDTGDVHDITGEWRGECDCLSAQLINANRERDRIMAEVEALRKEVERLQREERNDAIAYKAVIERQKELRVERDQIRAEANDLRKDAGRWQFIRDVWPKVKLVPNGEWFNSCFLEREIDAAMSKEAGHDR